MIESAAEVEVRKQFDRLGFKIAEGVELQEVLANLMLLNLAGFEARQNKEDVNLE